MRTENDNFYNDIVESAAGEDAEILDDCAPITNGSPVSTNELNPDNPSEDSHQSANLFNNLFNGGTFQDYKPLFETYSKLFEQQGNNIDFVKNNLDAANENIFALTAHINKAKRCAKISIVCGIVSIILSIISLCFTIK